MSLCRPMVSTSFWVKPMQADRSSHPPSFLTLNRPPPSFQSIGIKDAFHGSLSRECHCFPINWPTETVPYTLINKRPYIKEPPSERTPSKLSTYEILGPGMIILKNYVSFTDQVDIVNICEKWAAGPGGFYMYKSDEDRRRQMCFGRNWEPETGYRNCYRSNGFKPPPVPHEFISLAEAAIKDAQLYLDYLPSMYPDTCLVSFYETNGRLGLHQDCDESSDSLRRGLPVVSISIGTSAIFVYGRTKRKRKLKSVCLDSGDILIFGGKSRHIYHGVEQVSCFISTHGLYAESQMKLGRLSLTLRQF
ncbi:putative DNA oxidative demethylase [Helianthus annuus]|uniref:DNA oxidative demethylase n=1 Tax=Helianthus annuus TaxID=4232 RepID=A0A251U0L9_HELAN|nr:putative DNA oxidative demethylase [Helianthus annuus]KAJ0890919.1 putative DNA oxidative demethylase [Helianthus annuus]